MLTKTTNPFAAINQQYLDARVKARDFIMENLYWSKSTYYRKMEQTHRLTDRENEVVAFAFKKFIHEPLMAVFETAQA